MEQKDCITKRRKYKHLNESERYKIEGLLEAKKAIKEIAPQVVQLNTLDRPGTFEGIDPASKDQLEAYVPGCQRHGQNSQSARVSALLQDCIPAATIWSHNVGWPAAEKSKGG